MNAEPIKGRKGIPRWVEWCIIGAVVLILAGLLFPATSSPTKAKRVQARVDMDCIIAAFGQYEATYGHLPIRPEIATNNFRDFTFGTFGTSAAAVGVTNAFVRQANNSEVIAPLIGLTEFGDGQSTLNIGHSLNPQRIPFLKAKMVSETNVYGVGPDGVFRDPWGNPYIITLRIAARDGCRDAFYSRAAVSELGTNGGGFRGLVRTNTPPFQSAQDRDSFEFDAEVMVWSLGPDGKADASLKADRGVNKDNVVSW